MIAGIILWLALVAAAFFAAHAKAKKILPTSRWSLRAWLKASVLAVPWTLLLTPSLAIGAIPIPAPAVLLVLASLWHLVASTDPTFAADTNASGALAAVALVIAWALISLCALFLLRLAERPVRGQAGRQAA